MGVGIDETRRDHAVTGIDAALGAVIDLTERDYLAALHTDVGAIRRAPRAIDHATVLD